MECISGRIEKPIVKEKKVAERRREQERNKHNAIKTESGDGDRLEDFNKTSHKIAERWIESNERRTKSMRKEVCG